MGKGEYDKAIADFTEAIRLDPKYALAYANRGAAYVNKGDSDKAIADCTEAIRLDPKYALAYANRGAAYGTKGETDKAIVELTEAIRLDPKDAEVFNKRGVAHLIKGEHDKAIADYTEAIRLNPRDVGAYYSRGSAYCDKGDYDKAVTDFREAVHIAPENVSLWPWRVLVPLAAGRPDEYRKAISEMVERFGKSDDPWAALMVPWACAVRPDSGADWPRMQALAERGVQRAPESSVHLTVLGAVLYRAGSYEHALQRLSEADHLMRAPSESANLSPAETWFFLAMAHYRMGHKAEAKKVLDKASQWVEMDNRDSQAGVGRKLDFLRRQNLKLFQQEAEALLGVKAAPLADPTPPQSPESHYNRGRELARKGDFAGAIAAYRAAFRLGDLSPERYLEFGQMYAKKGEMGEAIVYFRVAMPVLTRSDPWLGWLSGWLPGVMRGTGKPSEIVFAPDIASIKSTGAKGTLAEPPDELRSAAEADAALLLAEVDMRLDHKDLARRWFDKAATWMDKNKTEAEGLRRYRAKAEKALGIVTKDEGRRIKDEKKR
jgi:tetratricopeptide (TPR) repeat protein